MRPVRYALVAATALAAGCGTGLACNCLPASAHVATTELGIVLLANPALDTGTQLELAAGLLDIAQEPRAAVAR